MLRSTYFPQQRRDNVGSDVLAAEVTAPSLGVGDEIGRARVDELAKVFDRELKKG